MLLGRLCDPVFFYIFRPFSPLHSVHVHQVYRLAPHPTHPSSLVSAVMGNNEVSVWDMETASRRQIVWASPTPPFGKMTDNVSKSADSYLPKASTCDSSWVLVIPVYTFNSKLESTVLVSVLMDTLIGMRVIGMGVIGMGVAIVLY